MCAKTTFSIFSRGIDNIELNILAPIILLLPLFQTKWQQLILILKCIEYVGGGGGGDLKISLALMCTNYWFRLSPSMPRKTDAHLQPCFAQINSF